MPRGLAPRGSAARVTEVPIVVVARLDVADAAEKRAKSVQRRSTSVPEES